jgi:O-acetyl-ADP-ribose deacetylase (regulator of RNase III)
VPLRIVRGDATSPRAKGPKLIAHICNDLGGWGKGFVLAVSRRRPEPEQDYRRWHRERAGNNFGLGAVQVVRVRPDTWVANMIGQHGMRRGSADPPDPSVHMPRIGCGLAGGTWERIGPLVEAALSERNIAVTVYDHD